MSEIENILKNRIKEERLNLNMNQEELGNKIGISNKNISKYESGIAKPNLDTLARLADIFNCSTDYLLGRTDDRNTEIYSATVDGEEYEMGLTRDGSPRLTQEKFERLIRKLKAVGFDTDKLMNDIDLDND